MPSSARATLESKKDFWFPVLTGRTIALCLGAAVIVAVLPLNVWASFLIVNAMLLLTFVIDASLAVKPSKVAIRRAMPALTTLDARCTLEWEVSNPSNRVLRVSIADEIPPSFRAIRRRARIRVPSGGVAYAMTEFCPERRGRFVLSRLVVRTVGPLGLAAMQGRRDTPEIIRVYPPFKSRKEAELRIEKARILEVGLRSVRGHGGGTEFEQLREYGVDDDYRRIDWAATARAGKPIVRTFRAERNQNVVILLDAGRVMAGRVEHVPRLEHAMDAAMALATVATRLGDRVGLIAFDQTVRGEVALDGGRQQVARITEAMYQLEPELVESNYQGAFVHTMTRFRRRSLVVLLTEVAQESINETLLPALPMIMQNHLVVVGGVADQQVNSWAHAVPVESGGAYRKAAAVMSLADRRVAVAQLRSRGATVVDAAPGKLAAELADAYLRVKATGRL